MSAPGLFGFFKQRRRAALRAQPLTEEERRWVSRAVHLWPALPPDDRHEIEATSRVFLAEKSIEGAGGLEVTDEMRWTIAAQASLMLLHRDTDVFPQLDTVLVYPHGFVVDAVHRDGPVVIAGPERRAGESWRDGLVVLAWDEVARDVRCHHGGHNVVLHELAHQLDAEDGAVDGAPDLGSRARFVAWARVLGEEYHALGERLASGAPSDIDAYGATSPAEFFAVVTEEFYERPAVLRARHPELYAELARFFQLDPAALEDPAPAR
jgi:Mlc titration factor MtfA (ptsG expression regulator)